MESPRNSPNIASLASGRLVTIGTLANANGRTRVHSAVRSGAAAAALVVASSHARDPHRRPAAGACPRRRRRLVDDERFKALDLHVITKPDLTPVTDADQAVEDDPAGSRPGTAARRRARRGEGPTGWGAAGWVIDPIDGTKNFVRGVPVWATLIGLMVEDEVVVGVVSAPALGRRWWAAKGGGAWTGKSLFSASPAGSPTSPSGRVALVRLDARWEQHGRLGDFMSLPRRCWRTRAYGDFWSLHARRGGRGRHRGRARARALRHGRPRHRGRGGKAELHRPRRRARPQQRQRPRDQRPPARVALDFIGGAGRTAGRRPRRRRQRARPQCASAAVDPCQPRSSDQADSDLARDSRCATWCRAGSAARANCDDLGAEQCSEVEPAVAAGRARRWLPMRHSPVGS